MKRFSGKRLVLACAMLVGIAVLLRFSEPVDIHLRYAASKAAWTGNVAFLRMARLLAIDLSKPVPGRGPMIVSAAYTGQNDVISYLLSVGVDIESKDKFGGTALSRAAQQGQMETVKMLLGAGADPNVRDLEGGNTPLDLSHYNAVRSGNDNSPIEELLVASGGQRNTTLE